MINFAQEDVLPATEATRFMCVTRKTLNRWFSRGLRNALVGGTRYTSKQAINEFQQQDRSPLHPTVDRAAHEDAERRLALHGVK